MRGITWGQRQFGRTWRWLVSLLRELRGGEVCVGRDVAVCCQPWWRCHDNLVSGHWEEDSTGTVRESSKPDCFPFEWLSHTKECRQYLERKEKAGLDRPESYGFSSLCQACAVEAISFTIVSSEAFVVLAFTSTTLLQGSSMAGTTLTVYVGLTPSDAEKIFKEHQAVQPHWKDRLGLKSTALEARTRVVFVAQTWGGGLPHFELECQFFVCISKIHLSHKCRPSSAATTRILKEGTSRRSERTRLHLLRMASPIWLYFDGKEKSFRNKCIHGMFGNCLFACLQVLEKLRAIGEGWYQYFGPLEAEGRASDGTLLYTIDAECHGII